MNSVATGQKNDFNNKFDLAHNRTPLLRGISLEIDEKNTKVEEEKKRRKEQSLKMFTELDEALVKLEKSKKHIERLENVFILLCFCSHKCSRN